MLLQERSRTNVRMKRVSGSLRVPTSWHVTCANTQETNPSAVENASAASRDPTTCRSTWNVTRRKPMTSQILHRERWRHLKRTSAAILIELREHWLKSKMCTHLFNHLIQHSPFQRLHHKQHNNSQLSKNEFNIKPLKLLINTYFNTLYHTYY